MHGLHPRTYAELRTANFLQHPFHCTECSRPIPFRAFQVNYKPDNKPRLMISSGVKELCGKCLSTRIRNWFDKWEIFKKTYKETLDNCTFDDRSISDGTCFVCNKKTRVISIIWDKSVDVRFGGQWWNGHHACVDCLCDAAINGNQVCSMITARNNSTRYINEVGAELSLEDIVYLQSAQPNV